jgi:DNA-binding PadR family transcriptional regulator
MDLMLLGLLTSRSMHGYEIAELLDQPRMQSWVRLGRTSIYYALGRLESRGYVSKHSERQGGKPERIVYSITDLGRRSFISGLEDALGSGEGQTDEFDIALFFSSRLDAPRTRDRIETRLVELENQAQGLALVSQESGAKSDGELMLVLEHRLAVLRADIDFLSKYVSMLMSGTGGAAPMVGSLAESSLSEILLNLSAAGRTGIFRVRTLAGTVDFCFDEGRLYGVVPVSGETIEESLRRALLCSRGEFMPSDVLEADAQSVGGLVQAVLIGSRDTVDQDRLQSMLPGPDTLLDIREGYEREVIGVNLTDEERAVLSELDGVRTMGEVARRLGWTTDRLRSTCYPLWLVGWVVRSTRSKRQLLFAASAYLRRWSEAIKLFAGDAVEKRVLEDVQVAADGSGLVPLRDIDRALEQRRIRTTEADLTEQIREYLGLLNRAVSARLGDGFAEDVSVGYAIQLAPDDRAVLEAHGLLI